MPGFDGTGPVGRGPMTGRGMGYCGTGLAIGARLGYGQGFGRGFGRGMGRGIGRGWFWCGPGRGYGRGMLPLNQQTEKTGLQEYAAFLKEELNAVKAELGRIEEKSEKE